MTLAPPPVAPADATPDRQAHAQADALHELIRGLPDDERRLRVEAAEPAVRKAYWRRRVDEQFDQGQLDHDGAKTHDSPSGRYRLTVTRVLIPGGWPYSQGVVSEGDRVIATVRRNIGHFPFVFVEGHPDGHDYLVCGEDYQGQTVVALDTGARVDHLPDEAEQGVAFCWTAMRFDAPSALLVVEGCIWACPYEYRFFDFARPSQGWPELDLEVAVEADERWPTFEADGTIRCHRSAPARGPEAGALAATWTFRREGQRLALVDEWASEGERAARQARAEREARAASEAPDDQSPGRR